MIYFSRLLEFEISLPHFFITFWVNILLQKQNFLTWANDQNLLIINENLFNGCCNNFLNVKSSFCPKCCCFLEYLLIFLSWIYFWLVLILINFNFQTVSATIKNMQNLTFLLEPNFNGIVLLENSWKILIFL